MLNALIGIFDKLCFGVSAGKVVSQAAVGLLCLSQAAGLCHSNSLFHNVFPQIIPALWLCPVLSVQAASLPQTLGRSPRLSAASKEGALGEPLRIPRVQGREEGTVPGAPMQVPFSPWNP